MASLDRALLARLMAAMAAGDQAALFPFIEEFGGRLAGTVRSALTTIGRPMAIRDAEDLDYLVQSAAFVIFERAGSWDPDGALPWTWAGRAIRAEVVAWLGHPSVELIDGQLDLREVMVGGPADVNFDELAAGRSGPDGLEPS